MSFLATAKSHYDTNRSHPRIGIYFNMALSPAIRLWGGVGDCKPGINAIDASDHVYAGAGELVQVGEVQQLINATAERVEFTLSGVDSAILDVATGLDVKDVPVSIGLGSFGDDWQVLDAVAWVWIGYADVVTVELRSGDDGKMVRAVKLSCGSLFTGRRRGRNAYWTDRDQRIRSSGDRFCERTPLYTRDTVLAWPRF